MSLTVLCYQNCNTCKKAEKWLKENNIEYNFRPIKEMNPTKDELILWIKLSGQPISKFFNTSGKLYKDQNLKDKLKTLSNDEQIEILASNGLLVKRPILVSSSKVLVGFKEDDWATTLK